MSDDAERDAVIDALLPQVPFDGWTGKALRQALASLGLHPDDAPLLFPGGAGEMIGAYAALADERMVAAAVAADLAAYRVPARVRAIIAIRLEQQRENREAIRRALAWMAVPANAPRAVKITAATVDSIWHAAGDTSADVSWYTKRGILAGVYASTLLFWLRDRSDEDEATLSFLDRRLENVGKIGKIRRDLEARLHGIGDRLRGFAPGRG
jgi:ubiquinone biosynthesis protein COQ9